MCIGIVCCYLCCVIVLVKNRNINGWAKIQKRKLGIVKIVLVNILQNASCYGYICAMNYEEINSKVAAFLLEAQAVKLSPEKPFTWASGWQSPIYCDNRVTLSYPAIRTAIKEYLAFVIGQNFANVQAIAGVATAGIAQGALVAEALGLPFLYVRPEPKKHGMGNQIEGKLLPGTKVVLIEDLISTGGSSLKAAEAVQIAGAEVLGMVAIFTYGFAVAAQNFTDKNIKLVTLSNYAALLPIAKDMGYVTADHLATLSAWRNDPANWGK
jgi:orotate phosphoribosyltransferase